jgi:hypothetical protein
MIGRHGQGVRRLPRRLHWLLAALNHNMDE